MKTLTDPRIWSCLFVISLAAAPVTPPDVPGRLKPPATQKLLLKAQGRGLQIYKCSAGPGDPTHFSWILEKPQATLTGDDGRLLGRHYEGPTWEAADGSRVVGQVEQRADSPLPNTIPWLLVKAQSTEGAGTFARVTYIQRVATQGGAAPAAGCDASHAGRRLSVDYQADYYFYVSPQP